jgi:hypothetical protein
MNKPLKAYKINWCSHYKCCDDSDCEVTGVKVTYSILGYSFDNLMIHIPLLKVAKLISIKFKDNISGFGPGRVLIKKKINFPHT